MIAQLFSHTGFQSVSFPVAESLFNSAPDANLDFVYRYAVDRSGAWPSVVPAQFGTGLSTEVTVTLREAISLFDRQWLPVPYVSSHPFWCRLLLSSEAPKGRGYLLVDTHVDYEETVETGGLVLEDIRRGPLIPVSGEDRFRAPMEEVFWRSDFLRSYIHQLASEKAPGEDQANPDYVPYLAGLRALFAYIRPNLPRIEILEDREPRVETTLAIDFGNSRTCAVIMEQEPNVIGRQERAPRFYRLDFRSRTRPWEVDHGIVDSRFVFSRLPRLTVGLGRGAAAFRDISLVRIGSEAQRLSVALSRGGGKQTAALSSFKRYLLDSTRREDPWSFIDEVGKGDEPIPITGPVLQYLEEEDPFCLDEAKRASVPGARHSRKTGLIFLALEVLTQAAAFINDVGQRRKGAALFGDEGRPRRRVLENVVITYPPCMDPSERSALSAGMEKAIRLWHRFVHDPRRFCAGAATAMPPVSPFAPPKPRLSCDCDEGMAVQFFYVYNELMGRFQNGVQHIPLPPVGAADALKQPAFNELRDNFIFCLQRDEHARVAGIDVGGGTTDMTVVDYSYSQPAVGDPVIEMRKVRAYGHRNGADDAVGKLIGRYVLPFVAGKLKEGDEWYAVKFMNKFSSKFANEPDILPNWPVIRHQMAAHVWAPAVWSSLDREGKTGIRARVGSKLRFPSEGVLLAFYSQVGKTDGSHNIWDAPFGLGHEEVDQAFKDTFASVFVEFNTLVKKDGRFMAERNIETKVVAAGRIIQHSQLHDRLMHALPRDRADAAEADSLRELYPTRVQLLSECSSDVAWCPFAEQEGGLVPDTKACVAMGALWLFHATYRNRSIEGITFRLVPSDEPRAPLCIIRGDKLEGIIEWEQKIPGEERSQPFVFTHEMVLARGLLLDRSSTIVNGFDPRWRLVWHPVILGKQNHSRREVRVQLVRKAAEEDDLHIEVLSGQGAGSNGFTYQNNHIVLERATIYNKSYWADTGIFS